MLFMVKLIDTLTEHEIKEICKYRELMNNSWSKWKTDKYFYLIMEILDNAEQRYYKEKE